MTDFIRGNVVKVPQTVWTPTTGPVNAATVAFKVTRPDGTVSTYTLGADAQVTHSGTGIYTLEFDTTGQPLGTYYAQLVSTGPQAVGDPVEFTVVGSPADPGAPALPGPAVGPCTPWVDAGDVAGWCNIELGSQEQLAELAATVASEVLFAVSGRQFTGLCGPRTVRPNRDPCSCWDSSVGGYWWANGAVYGYSALWAWWNGAARVGCDSVSEIVLAGYPVREIVSVKIDGAVVDPATYRLDGHRRLVRLDDAGPPVSPRRWPGCQNHALADTEPGTFAITYRWGMDPPASGRVAAQELGCQFLSAWTGGDCKIPVNATKIARQGVTVEKATLSSWLDPKRPTGLPAIDAFLAAHWAPGRSGRRGAVFSPDVRGFGRTL